MRQHSNPGLRFTLIGSLYVSQAIPLGFFTVALPAILRSRGVELRNIGLLSALALPWLIKFLWAPFVDRYGSQRWGHYRSWILLLQGLSVLSVVAIALLDPSTHMGLLILAGALFMFLAATQDVATDGLSVHILSQKERGPGNGFQVGGFYLGQILGGGVMLLVFGRFGWTLALIAMASFLALPLLPALRFREPPHGQTGKSVDFRALGRFFTRDRNRPWLLILIFFRAGEAMAVTMANPMLIDLGYSLAQIGLLFGVAGSLAAFAGATASGLLMQRLGRKPSLVVFGLLQSVALCGYLLPANGLGGEAAIYLAVVMVSFTGGMATTALYTNMMDRCCRQTAATDFSLQQSLAAVGPILAATLSGFSASALGYSAHFMACIALNVVVLLAVARWLVHPVAPVPEPATEPGQ